MTFHLHIKGRVQGVGFRPYIYKLAIEKKLTGTVSNTADGVHIFFNCLSGEDAKNFQEEVIAHAPGLSIITSSTLAEAALTNFENFSIVLGETNRPNLLISPDFALCVACNTEFHSPENRRSHYPFITCTLCGPRFSIMSALPYERHLTTMQPFKQCEACMKEYENAEDRRYFSQTNSCPVCGVPMSWHSKNGGELIVDENEILSLFVDNISAGKIIAVKGIGGYLLICDAKNKIAIETLRQRKHRPSKPFAVLFPGIDLISRYTYLNPSEKKILTNEISPIVIVEANDRCREELCMEAIAPGLSSIGIMLPYAPLLEWLVNTWKNPLIATSGNLSGSSIVFQS
ncbi:MAG: Sua5/YciO/YrdC/YwlC family protein, partial [Ginsengibacter sp.]